MIWVPGIASERGSAGPISVARPQVQLLAPEKLDKKSAFRYHLTAFPREGLVIF
jgi:hypothetical protein